MRQIEFPNIPEGFKTFKCASPGCPKMATHVLEMRRTLAHLSNRTRCFCAMHAQGIINYEGEGKCNVVEAQAPEGLFLYRKHCDAVGCKGWEYAIPKKV